ncbi:hypothetical protein DO021_02690 [Desulfobacter hydrogenophilus]|uniref:Exonuclease domain-containing protein n=2 Tax=Desulfobacter hydrogenophilus TaxID=2291 RepID=A0A328FI51_9BACT|nr:hypothetical protein [Desulfobacter hydrogenophilus]QBH12231.1 hypothetical protein EYB58_04420 [Desulfobacter hydrogenophilus]RAM03540.1 hypothetical protein DO021_02690 [Desulfobacter hydrogenophilus]
MKKKKNIMPFRPFIVDVESSGLGCESYPIEIGLALEGENRYCSLILPADRWTHWDTAAQDTHHISREVLIKYGKPLNYVAKGLNRVLKGLTVYSDGWVTDKLWVTRLFSEAGIRQAFTISPLECILTEPQMEIWHTTKDSIIASMALTRHRACSDAFIIQETFYRTRMKTQHNTTH